LAKTEIFQDLSLQPPRDGLELWRWLYRELRGAILDGRLKRGVRMPSTRSLARQYGLSRGTVIAAFEQLRVEGYTHTRIGSGTFVASGLPDRSMTPRSTSRVPDLPPSTATLSRRGLEAIEGLRVLPASRSLGKAFRPWEPGIDLFPAELWARVAGRVLRRVPRSIYGQGSAGGYIPLKKAIAEYVGASRGVRCTAAQVMVTSGAQQALYLAASLLLDPGDRVLMEDPGYPGASFAFRAAGARLIPIRVDGSGLDVPLPGSPRRRARLAYVTTTNQFPLGVTTSLNRRLALLNWAVSENAWIIEDEYDAEYRYSGRPWPALQNLDRSGSVLYIGTFTKMLFNALRLGFIVLPERLVDAFEAARTIMDRHPPTLDQAILAEFISEGHFGHHVRRMREVYMERMSVLVDASRRRLGGMLNVAEAAAGMRTIGWLAPGASDIAAAEKARALGLEIAALSEFTTEHSQPPALILGFAGCTPGELRRGVGVLAAALGN
jgi:GntR family transcriptional regulator / MocR family aminotransferase